MSESGVTCSNMSQIIS